MSFFVLSLPYNHFYPSLSVTPLPFVISQVPELHFLFLCRRSSRPPSLAQISARVAVGFHFGIEIRSSDHQLEFQQCTQSKPLTVFSKNSAADTPSRLLVRAWNNYVHRTPVIPHGNRANRPLSSHRMIISRVDMIMEELEQFVRLCLFELRKPGDEAVVHVETFEFSDRMCANCWVMRINRSTVGRDFPKLNECII